MGAWRTVFLPPSTAPTPVGTWAAGSGRRGEWMTGKKECACSSLSLPLPVSFPHMQPPTGTGGGWCSLNTGNWLSPWSLVYFPPPLSPSPRPSPGLPPSCLEQLGNLRRNTAVMGLPCAQVALVCPVLPCDRLGRVFGRTALEAPKPAALSLAVVSSTLICSAPPYLPAKAGPGSLFGRASGPPP